MSSEKKETLLAFFCGDILVTWLWAEHIFQDAGMFLLKLLATIVLGVAGGIAGLVGKDVYRSWKNWRLKQKNKNGKTNPLH